MRPKPGGVAHVTHVAEEQRVFRVAEGEFGFDAVIVNIALGEPVSDEHDPFAFFRRCDDLRATVGGRAGFDFKGVGRVVDFWRLLVGWGLLRGGLVRAFRLFRGLIWTGIGRDFLDERRGGVDRRGQRQGSDNEQGNFWDGHKGVKQRSEPYGGKVRREKPESITVRRAVRCGNLPAHPSRQKLPCQGWRDSQRGGFL